MDESRQSNDSAFQLPDHIIDGTTLPTGKRYRDPIVLDVAGDSDVEIESYEVESGELIAQQARRITDVEIDHINVVVDELMTLPSLDGLTVKCENSSNDEFSHMKIGEVYLLSLKFGKTKPVFDVRMFGITGLEHPHFVRGYIRKSIRYGDTYTALKIIVIKTRPAITWKVLDFYDSIKKPRPINKKSKVDPLNVDDVEIVRSDPINVEIISMLVNRWSPIVKAELTKKIYDDEQASIRAEVKEQILKEERLAFAKNSSVTAAEMLMIDEIVSRFINKQ